MTARRVLLCLSVLLSLPACSAPDATPESAVDPGPDTLRRLTRTEYGNTVRDVLGGQHAADRFPDDDVAEGFDNIAQVLSVSPLHVDLWQRAAEALAAEALRPDGAPVQKQLDPAKFHRNSGVIIKDGELVLTTDTSITSLVDLPLDGHYTLQVRAYEDHAGADFARMEISIDNRPPQAVTVTAMRAAPQIYKVEFDLFAGPHNLAIAFTNALPDPGPMRDLVVGWARLAGPAGQERPNPQLAQILTCTPADDSLAAAQACARQILGRLARRLWRRPVTADELERLLALFQLGLEEEAEDFTAGIKVALQGVLMSPHFLYRVELDPEPDSLVRHPLSGPELATRLSYFLWSSAPDEALLQAAESGQLAEPAGITAQVGRMLADPRAAALVTNFAAQWLALRAIDSAEPDMSTYPAYRPSLRTAMAEETRRFLAEFFPQPGAATPAWSLQQLPSAAFTFVNRELAQHYGLPAPSGDEWRKVTLAEGPRRGLLTQGSVLLSTSYPARTSPVRRGKWVLEQLLCTPPPPPPPNVVGDFGKGPTTGTLRQRLEQHRANSYCASCHKRFDPIGFALENFDGIGAYRTTDGGAPVDASGVLADGRAFKDATELAALLAADPQLGRCAVEKIFTYALGRAPGEGDKKTLDALQEQLAPRGYLASELALQVVLSETFRTRRGEGSAQGPGAAPSTPSTTSFRFGAQGGAL